jgi:hypothetical protein
MGEKRMSEVEAIELVEAIIAGEKPLDLDEDLDRLVDAIAEISSQSLMLLDAALKKANSNG